VTYSDHLIASKELAMHVCVAQAPAGKVNNVIREKCLLAFKTRGTIWSCLQSDTSAQRHSTSEIRGDLQKMKTDEQSTTPLNEMLICSICLTTDSYEMLEEQ